MIAMLIVFTMYFIFNLDCLDSDYRIDLNRMLEKFNRSR